MTALLAWLWPYLAAIGAAIAALASLYFKGRADARGSAVARDAAETIETRRRMDDAETHLGDDPDVARDWLRERDPDQR